MGVELERIKRERLIADELARRGFQVVRNDGRSAVYHCPLPDHEDLHPSFTVYREENRFHCYGCGRNGSVLDLVMALDGVGIEQAVITLDLPCGALEKDGSAAGPRPTAPPSGEPSPVEAVTALHSEDGLTLEALGAAKKLEKDFLISLGLRDETYRGQKRVAIPYLDESGATLAIRYRHGLARGSFRWRSGDKVHLYGLWRMEAARTAAWVLVVEGESDCWACWAYGIPAVGVPGKTTWQSGWAEPLKGVQVFVWQEPDAEDFPQRMSKDLPGLKVIVAPEGVKDPSEAHMAGYDLAALVERLCSEAVPVGDLRRKRDDAALAEVEAACRSVLESPDPYDLVRAAVPGLGYGGDPKPVLTTYICFTGRVLAMHEGSMPAHLLLVGPASAGKSYTKKIVCRLMPPSAYYEIDAGSPRVLIYLEDSLQYRVLSFGEADSLPAGEDNPAASAVRNLCQDHHLNYDVVLPDPETGEFRVKHISKPGPTTLVTTSTRRLGPQLDTRFHILEVPDTQEQLGSAIRAHAALDLRGGPPEPDPALIAYQEYLQMRAPWDVIVPFAGELADYTASQPMESRVARDFARMLTLIKAVTILRHRYRKQDDRGRYLAEPEDYEAVYELVADDYRSTSSGASQAVRETVEAVRSLLDSHQEPVTVTKVAEHLLQNKMAASRRVRAALKGEWLTNSETRKGYPYQLGLGEPLPSEVGLMPPAMLRCNTLTTSTGEGVPPERRTAWEAEADALLREHTNRLAALYSPGCSLEGPEWDRHEEDINEAYAALDLDRLVRALEAKEAFVAWSWATNEGTTELP